MKKAAESLLGSLFSPFQSPSYPPLPRDESAEGQATEREIQEYFAASPRKQFNHTDHGIDTDVNGVIVRVMGAGTKVHVDVWITGRFEDSEHVEVSNTTRWRKADFPNDFSSFLWNWSLRESHFAEAVDMIVRKNYGAKYPHLAVAGRQTALDERTAIPFAQPANPK